MFIIVGTLLTRVHLLPHRMLATISIATACPPFMHYPHEDTQRTARSSGRRIPVNEDEEEGGLEEDVAAMLRDKGPLREAAVEWARWA